jgi:preprotein translocase subunit YajC
MEALPFLALIALTLWFVAVRPQRTLQKRRNELMARLSPGDEVVTVGGILGTVASVAEDVVELDVADGVRMRFDPRAVAQIVVDQTAGAADAEVVDDDAGGASPPGSVTGERLAREIDPPAGADQIDPPTPSSR